MSVGAIGEIRLSEIEWPAGYRPDDGTASDARMSRLTVLTPKDQILVGRSLLLRVSLRDSFGNVPINQSLATLALAVVNGSQSLARVVGRAQDAAPEPEPEWAQETAEKDFELELLASGELYIEVRLSGRPGLPLLPLGEHSCTVLAPAPPDRTAWYAAAAALGAGVLLGGGFYLMHRRSRRAIEKSMLRLRSSGRPPALQLGPNERWHLFLSHTWGSGQDQAHALKEQTLRMLPSCKVFLDVHDLDDIDKLEQYIAATAVILLFISKDYFKSPNCLREVRAALDQKKPLLLVHEANVKRGGDTLEALMSECPEELRDAVFSGRPVLPYLRLPQLQLQTVVEICLGVVRVSGKMAKGSWLRGLESATGLDLDGDGAVGPEASASGKGRMLSRSSTDTARPQSCAHACAPPPPTRASRYLHRSTTQAPRASRARSRMACHPASSACSAREAITACRPSGPARRRYQGQHASPPSAQCAPCPSTRTARRPSSVRPPRPQRPNRPKSGS